MIGMLLVLGAISVAKRNGIDLLASCTGCSNRYDDDILTKENSDRSNANESNSSCDAHSVLSISSIAQRQNSGRRRRLDDERRLERFTDRRSRPSSSRLSDDNLNCQQIQSSRRELTPSGNDADHNNPPQRKCNSMRRSPRRRLDGVQWHLESKP